MTRWAPPPQLLAGQLAWAIDHGFDHRVRLLLANGLDAGTSLPDGRTAVEHALAGGRLGILDQLRAAGATVPSLSRSTELMGQLLAGDSIPADVDTELLRALRRAHPALIHRARSASAVRLLANTGFDVNARSQGTTALHEAAFAGDVELISALVESGADPGILDDQFHTTALRWAQYACQPAAVEILTAVTPGERQFRGSGVGSPGSAAGHRHRDHHCDGGGQRANEVHS